MPHNPNLLVFQPFIVMAAVVGTAFPGVWLTSAQVKALAAWSLVADGTAQEDGKPLSDSGLTITKSQTVDLYRTYGRTGPVKARRSSQDLMVGFNSPDMTLETLTRLINNVAVTPVANVVTGEASHRGDRTGRWRASLRGRPARAREDQRVQRGVLWGSIKSP